jgi:arsenite methyltransferase
VSIHVHDVEQEVLDRYARGAERVEPALCCPVSDYEQEYLTLLPREIVEKDYGCGNPSRWAGEGDVVVDLGSGAGKACYILAQKVGATGRVIGVDFNDAMLGLSRKYQEEMAGKLGYANVSFVKARIQDLALDLDRVQQWLDAHPVRTVQDLGGVEAECDRLRRQEPMIPADSVDLIVSNCVLNLVKPQDKLQLFSEMFRVLKRGGRAVISDIVCDEDPTPAILQDPELWSGCISGAFREDLFLKAFEDAGFHGVEILERQDQPWRIVDDVEFRSMTVRAYKGKDGPCLERHQAVVYRGPWRCVCDDDGHTYHRGLRMAVCDKTYRLLTDPKGPYARQLIGIEPADLVPLDAAGPFDCASEAVRHPRVAKATSRGGESPCCLPANGHGKCC